MVLTRVHHELGLDTDPSHHLVELFRALDWYISVLDYCYIQYESMHKPDGLL